MTVSPPAAAASVAARLGEVLQDRAQHVAVAESLTGGLLTNCLAAAPGSSGWLRGGVVAYDEHVKHGLLAVRDGPVVSEGAAVDMAEGVRRLAGAALGVAVTGAGGPDPQDGQPPGTVWIAVAYEGIPTRARLVHLDGDPAEVCEQTCDHALRFAEEVLQAAG